MTLLEFLEARDDPASTIAWLDLAEYHDWLLLFASLEGKPVQPIIGLPRAEFEAKLRSTDLRVSDGGGEAAAPGRRFEFGARVLPLAEPDWDDDDGGDDDDGDDDEEQAADEQDEIAQPTRSPADGDRAWNNLLRLVSKDGGPPPVSPAVSDDDVSDDDVSDHAPKLRPVPEPASAEDRDALTALIEEYERLSAKAARLFALNSPPIAMIDDLTDDLRRQIDNFEDQRQMIAGRGDLAAFPVQLDRVLFMLGLLVDRCSSERAFVAMPWAVKARAEVREAMSGGAQLTPYAASPTPAAASHPAAASRPAVPSRPAEPPAAAPADALAAIQRQLAELTRQIATFKQTPAAAPAAKPPLTAAETHSKEQADRLKQNAQILADRQKWFEKVMEDHRKQQEAFDKTNAAWLADFRKR